MKKQIQLYSILIFLILAFIFIVIYLISNPEFQKSNDFIEALLGALYGTMCGAGLMFYYQTRSEKTKNFMNLFKEGQNIMAQTTAWKLVNGKWENIEFRNAVGISSWVNEPRNHQELTVQNPKAIGIDWGGIVYKIDDNFCIASKSIQEYSTWFRNVLEFYALQLIDKIHLYMMWRILTDSIYDYKNIIGMKKWLEFFLFKFPLETNDYKSFLQNLKSGKYETKYKETEIPGVYAKYLNSLNSEYKSFQKPMEESKSKSENLNDYKNYFWFLKTMYDYDKVQNYYEIEKFKTYKYIIKNI